jgi:transcriptional regulator with XRE-family HTH domain
MAKSVFTDVYAGLVSVLIEAREAASITQAELARRIGTQQSVVSKIERRERRLDVVEFIEIAHALNIEPDDLLRRVINKMPYRA